MCSRADKAGYPPPLPLKQRRSANSGGSSTGSSMDLELEAGEGYSILGSPHEATPPPLSEVFSPSTDCHAPRCPIHHRDGHQERFFSEGTPPPVPKKRLARALSLPGGCLHPRCSLPSRHQNYDNPLYMLTPIRDSQLEVERERERQQPTFQAPPPPRLPLGLLTFDTPDPQLACFFRSFQDQEQVSLDIQECHLLFLKRIARQLETPPLGWVESTKGIESFQPQEFQLCEGHQSRKIGDAVFYSVHCPQLPGRVFSAKVYRPNSEAAAAALLKPLPPHINIQQLLVHFPQCPGPERDVSAEDRMSLESPDGGSTERGESPERRSRTVASLLSDGYAADVERELPGGTLEDFVRDGAALRRARPQLYERQLGLLLLQVARGLLHLREHGAVCAELRPRDVILAWPGTGNGNGGGAEGGTEGAGQRGAAEGGATEGLEGGVEMGAGEGENPGAPVQELWKRWGPPRAALTAFQPQSEREANGDSDEVRLGRLLLLCLHHLPEAPVPETPVPPPDPRPSGWDPPQGPPPSPSGLLRLAHLLLDPESGVRTAEAAGVLQVLLWGPRAELFLQGQPGASWPALLASWLSLKRSLLLQELSELALSDAEGRPDREDILCLQYLSAAEPDGVLKVAALLGLHYTAP